MGFEVHLVDGTYELFRYFFAVPSHITGDGREVGATRGVVGTVLQLLEEGATHIGVATDHVIESFRNDLWAGYKDGSGIDPALRTQFEPVEDALAALGVAVWPMVEYEADDALGAAARMASVDDRVERVVICTPDKDLGQVVDDTAGIVQLDRRKAVFTDEAGVVAKFGVGPASIPDYLALVGDSADGFPGIAGWGAKSTAAVLSRYGHLEDIPRSIDDWDISLRGAAKLAANLFAEFELALLFRRIATIEYDAPVSTSVDDLEWTGPEHRFLEVANSLDAPGLAERAATLASRRP